VELEVGGGDWSACLSEDEASNFVRGALPRARFHAIEAHLDSCSDCLTYVAALAAAIGSGAAGNDESRESTHRLIDALDDAWFRGTDRFAVVRRLGSGGMGLVYEAFDRERGTRVALKVLPTRRPEALLRFKNEFRSLQDLQHPNLVRMGELFVHEDQWFFTMELVEGIDFLRYVWRKAPIYDQPRLRSALRQLAVGLSTLHASGQVHRDIKPKNILVTPTGRLVILDFGLVHAGEAFEASDLHTVGTVAYMAPEQASSQPIDAAADWYSVGVMLFEALTGHLPFEGAPRDILAAKRERDPPTVESFDPNAPADLASLCNQLLRLRPSDRPTGAEVLWRLGAAVPPSGGQVAPAAPPAAPFVGRTDELTRLRGAFAATSAGRAAVVIIAGESGIGKTALARRFTDLARAQRPDAIVLRGRCYEREAVAYKAFDGVLDALSRFLLQLAHDEAAALLPHGKTSLLARAFPVLGRVDAVAAAPPPEHEVLDPQELRSQVFSALRELFSRLGERHPLVVVIDDLQWSDADSLALLGELMREPDPPALLLLATLRSDDTGARPAIRELPGTLQRLGDKVSTLHLERLPRADAETLARALLNERAAPPAQLDAQQLAEEARGHPLYIDELARHPVGFGLRQPRALRLDEVLWSRVEHLDPASRQVLAAVAIAGGPLPQEAARRATHLPPEDLDRVLTVLRVEHLTRTTGAERSDLVECYHDRVREAVVGHLAAGAEREIHRELALALAETADPEQLAVHWHAAGERQRAANYAIRAAEAAADALAFARAARLYRFALELVDEADPRRY